jgi:imidazolonepropionase-like amidohydrolase
VIDAGTLVVDGSRIVCVAADCDVSGADRIVDVGANTLIPGLVDMHSHHYFEHRGIQPRHDFEQAVYLAYGITANMEPSIWSQTVFPAAELIDAGIVLGPRTFSTGDPLYQGDGVDDHDKT